LKNVPWRTGRCRTILWRCGGGKVPSWHCHRAIITATALSGNSSPAGTRVWSRCKRSCRMRRGGSSRSYLSSSASASTGTAACRYAGAFLLAFLVWSCFPWPN